MTVASLHGMPKYKVLQVHLLTLNSLSLSTRIICWTELLELSLILWCSIRRSRGSMQGCNTLCSWCISCNEARSLGHWQGLQTPWERWLWDKCSNVMSSFANKMHVPLSKPLAKFSEPSAFSHKLSAGEQMASIDLHTGTGWPSTMLCIPEDSRSHWNDARGGWQELPVRFQWGK